eukprot:3192153-Rhodomonas_salina.1
MKIDEKKRGKCKLTGARCKNRRENAREMRENAEETRGNAKKTRGNAKETRGKCEGNETCWRRSWAARGVRDARAISCA